MSRSARLLDLLQSLRRRRYAISGRALAEELGVSLRTLYRDIGTLRGQGVPIGGEAGVGYLLGPGYAMPPLMFTPEEIEALVLGIRWVVERADGKLGMDARNALAKIGAVLPPVLKGEIESSNLLIAKEERAPVSDEFILAARRSIRGDSKLSIAYRDLGGNGTKRTIWPFALAFFDQVQVVLAWCELRGAFRNFRADRVEAWEELGQAYPRRHQDLLAEWRIAEGVPPRGLDS